jgi:hypothetical protein
MHALVQEGAVVKYPYSVWDLRRDHRNVSFPQNVTDEVFAEYGAVPVVPTPPPDITYAQNREEVTPVFSEGQWKQTWIVLDLSPEELAIRKKDQEEQIRGQRNEKLFQSDWTMLSDAPIEDHQAWVDYRQALRDVTTQEDYPWVVIWPEPPN